MDLFSYIVRYDGGFAPNPFGGVCTLACCKPVIRRTASLGDWIMGTAPSPNMRGLVFIMKVTRGLPFDFYFQDPKYESKKQRADNPCGDNIYRPVGSGKFEQIPNPSHDSRHIAKDLSTNRVLISDQFYYFGRDAPDLPEKYLPLVHKTQGHKRIRQTSKLHPLVIDLLTWLEENFEQGVNGEPTLDQVICLPEEEEDQEI